MKQPILRGLLRRIVFFSSLVKQINGRYPTLFPKADEEDVQEGEGSSEERRTDEPDGSDEASSFSNK